MYEPGGQGHDKRTNLGSWELTDSGPLARGPTHEWQLCALVYLWDS